MYVPTYDVVCLKRVCAHVHANVQRPEVNIVDLDSSIVPHLMCVRRQGLSNLKPSDLANLAGQ